MTLLAAASHEIPLIDLDGTLLIQLGLFLLLIFLLNRFLFRPYLQLVARRDRAIEGRVREAEALEQKACARLDELERQLAAAKVRAADERARIRAEAAQREREIVEVARKEVAQSVASAKAEIAQMGARLRAELAPEVDSLASLIASKVLGKDLH